MLTRGVAVWLCLLALAFANGAIRELWLIPRFGAAAGHIVSTIALSVLILLLSWFTIQWVGPRSSGETWTIALLWVGLTLAFEFLAGHYLFGTPWTRLLADYNIFRGRIWVLVLVTTAIAPFVSAAGHGLMRGGK